MKTTFASLLVVTATLLAGTAPAASVTSKADSGPGSLRDAIANAAPGETITFAGVGTITLTSGELLITKNLTISGPGAGNLVIQRSAAAGTSDFRIFNCSAVVIISGVTISNGRDDVGGGIYNDGNLTLMDCDLTGNFAAAGGGLANDAGTLVISNCVFWGNTVVAATGDGKGGGIYNLGAVDAVQCLISSNSVTSNTGGGFGGGIENDGTLTLSNSIINGNSAIGSANNGGAFGGGIDNEFGTVNGAAITVSGNVAQGGGGSVGGLGEGGGIANGSGTVTLERSTVSGNHVVGGGGSGGGSDGGGIANDFGTIYVDSSTVSGNVSSLGASGSSLPYGGGIFNGFGSSLVVTYSTIASNAVAGGSAGDGGGIYNYGGAVELDSTILAANNATVDLVNDTAGAGNTLSYGFNVLGTTSGLVDILPGDQTGITATQLNLGPLQANGGPTFTHALLCGSVALNAGDLANAPATDQRGFPRIVNGAIDAGAYESGNLPPVISCPSPVVLNNAPATGQLATLSVSVADPNGDPLSVVWVVDGTPQQTNQVAAGGPPTAATVNFSARFGIGLHLISTAVTDPSQCVATCATTVNVTPAAQNPALQLTKTASPTNPAPGQAVTYYYAVTNTGNTLLTNINILDDNGTTADTSDDYVVNAAPFSLAAGQGTVFAITHISEPLCVANGGTNLTAGTLTVNVLTNGNVEVFYLQTPSLNDNRYGTNATAATGWASGHKFTDLVSSDEATFLFTDGNGKAVLEFQADYLSQAASAQFGDGFTLPYPSGYGTQGALGGDGKMLIGSSSNVLSVHTTLSDSLNQPGFAGYTVNSPKETSPLSGVSIPAGWNYLDGYHVIVSSNAFGAAGFGAVTIPLVHNSPSKLKLDKASPTNVCACVVNTAGAIAYQGTALVAAAFANATVCFGPPAPCNALGACRPPYPFASANPWTSVAFNEAECLAANVIKVVSNCVPTQVEMFYVDEHAMTLGMRQLITKTKSGTKTILTTNNYSITPLGSNPGSAVSPATGATVAQGGMDVSGRPIFPAMFVTDITGNPPNPYAGDWQYGGTPQPPTAVFGTWKGAVATLDTTVTPNAFTVMPDADPAKNNLILGPGSDPVPAGLTTQGYTTEIRWDISSLVDNFGLPLQGGHTYRLYFMVHDGDQNKAGGDVGQACGTITIPYNNPCPCQSPTMSLACASTTTGTVGSPYAATLPFSGGCGPYNFTIIGGSLPAGLTLNASTGVISGTPTTAGTFSYTAQVMDACGNTANTIGQGCAITVGVTRLSLSCVGNNTGTVGVPYSVLPPLTGGCAPYQFSIIGGALPAGLTLNAANGIISGTPTAAGTSGYTIKVTDACGKTASTADQGCYIQIVPAPPACIINGVTISGTSWNKFNVPAGASPVVWVNAHIGTPKGIPTTGITTVTFAGATLSLNNTVYSLPDGVLTFDPSAPATATTTFTNGKWQTLLNPKNLSDEIFFTGAAIPVTPAVAAGAKATLTYNVLSSVTGLAFPWQWSAGVYTYWPTDWNQAKIQSAHVGDHAGTPENPTVQKSLIQGPRGGGGSNFTGSWSATGNAACQ